MSQLRPGITHLAFLCEQLEQIARTAGDCDIVVSATPSENTVRFYLGRGFEPMADPLAELFEREPEDVHMRKMLWVLFESQPGVMVGVHYQRHRQGTHPLHQTFQRQ
ncbi:MAG: hypothetical protein JOZ87_28630 [Chloroflexi bacterium]|nr:hypothetical protein [Chloroflexota bacterium]